MQDWQLAILVCPFDHGKLALLQHALRCTLCDRRFAVVDGIPRFVVHEMAAVHEHEEWRRKQTEMNARDQQAHLYDRLLGLVFISPVERRLTLRALAGGRRRFGSLVEIGCGTGRMLQHLARLTEQVIGVDFSFESLRICRQRMEARGLWQQTLLVHADACHLPLADQAMDSAASCQLIEHLPSERLRHQFLAEMVRVLKPGGRYAVSGYHWSWLTRWNGHKEGMHKGGIYYHRFTRNEFRELISAHIPVESLKSVMGYVCLASGTKGGSYE